MDGFIIIDKQKDMTSFDVVFKMKKLFQTKKVGHSGTLDPNATGVLVVAVGRATKFLPIITENSEKQYQAEVILGSKTDTDDITGKEILTKEVKDYSKEELLKVLNSFEKSYLQYPPRYSAKKINGKKMYELARAGEEFEIKPSLVNIKKIDLISQNSKENFTIDCLVGKGTYIRSLIVDIAEGLQTVGTMGDLRRLKTDGFDISQAVTVDEAKVSDLIDLKTFVTNKYCNVYTSGKELKQVSNGVVMKLRKEITYPCVYISSDDKEPICIYDKKMEEAKLIFKF